MKVLIVGAYGQLGRELLGSAPPQFEIQAAGREICDIRDAAAVKRCVDRCRPGLIINAAGYTAMDRAETEREAAYDVNAIGAGRLAVAAEECGARLIHISTDYVFDGTKSTPYLRDDDPRPVNIYGKSKLEGERRIARTLGPQALIVRTAWLYATHGRNFVTSMLGLMREREETRVVCDQIGSPTWARGLACALWQAAVRPGLHGVYHWTDAGVASWYDLAVAIQEEALALGLLERPGNVVPIRTDEYPMPARRPAYTVLDKSDTWRDFGVSAGYWRNALREMLKEVLRTAKDEPNQKGAH